MLRSRNLTIALLLGVLIGMIAPAAGANPPLYLSPSATSVQPSISNPQPVRVLSSAATGAAFEVAVSWDQLVLEPTTANGKTYVQVSLPGWASTSQAGAPSLPVLAKAVAAPQGATVTVRVTPGQAHTVALPAPPLPVASQVVEWAPPAPGAAPALPEPITAIEEDPAIYTGVAAYPAALAEVTSDGVMRQQRVLGIAAYPVQYNPAAQQLIVYESLRVEVVFAETPTSEALKTTGHVAPGESAAYEDLMRGELLNYEAARAWRSDALTSVAATGETEATGVETTATGIDASPWTPPAPGWRVTVREEGFYKLTYTELQQAGLPVDTLAPATFKLFNLGREVAIHEQGDGDSQFEAGEYLLFYGQAINNKYTTDNIYWLTYGATAGLRMAARDGTPGDAVTPASYTAQRHLEGNAYYVSFMPGDDNLERWLWDYIYRPSRPSWTHTFTLAEPYAGPATLTVAMLGYLTATANPDHHAAITLNGTPVGDVTWDGIAWYVSQISVPAGILVAGTNTLAVTSVADTGYAYDVFYIDWVQLAFSNTFTAEDDALRFTIDTSGVWKYQVNGFSTDQVAAYDVTDPAAVSRIEGINVQGDGPYSVLFQDTVEVGGGPMSLLQETATAANYWAIADTAYQTIQAETDIEADIASSLQATTQGADHVIITHPDFLAQAAQLRDYRISQGLRAIVADIRDVYDEFGYGIEGAAPIHDFLAHTYASWQAPAPSYVVLLGDGHYDPKNYVYTRTSYIPPYLAAADPWIRETAADNRYVTVAGDDILPDMMLGRMSVNSAAEASAFVNKIIAYEASPAGDWQQRVLAVADNADSGGDFDLMSDDLLSAHLPDPYQAQKVYYGVTHTTTDGARTAIQDGINAGALIVNYIGHAYAAAWAEEDLLKTSDVPLLQNAGKFPVMLGMDCREGYYHSPNPLADGQEALAEVITRAEGKGAVASWSPAGLGVATGHDHLDRGFFDAVFTDNLGTVGAGTTAGKLDLFATGSNLDLLDTFLLFGDPATQLARHDGATPTPTATATPANTATATPIATVTATPTTALPALHMDAITISSSLKKTTFTVTAASRVLDSANKTVASAMVYGTWTLPDGSTTTVSALSARTGAVSLKVSSTQQGAYTLCVTDVTKNGFSYDPSANVNTCVSLTIPSGSTPTATSTPVSTVTTAPTATATPIATVTATPETALPALHMDAITISSSLKKTTYTITATSRVLDAAEKTVASAMVNGIWTLPGGSTTPVSALSGRTGAVSLKVSSTLKGTYTLCVTNVTKNGYSYDPSTNVETCDSLTIQ